jgi:hypothetical protein
MLTSSVLEHSNIVAAWYDGSLTTDEMCDLPQVSIAPAWVGLPCAACPRCIQRVCGAG